MIKKYMPFFPKLFTPCLAFFFFFYASCFFKPAPSSVPPLPKLQKINSVSLINQDGKPIAEKDWVGKILVLNLIFTNCPHICPRLTEKMKELQDALLSAKNKELLKKTQLISLTVDPKNDTPHVLKKYGEKFGANFQIWSFLTGEIGTIQQFAQKSLLSAVRDDKSGSQTIPELVIHSEKFVLIDAESYLRSFLDVKSKEDIRKLVDLIDSL